MGPLRSSGDHPAASVGIPARPQPEVAAESSRRSGAGVARVENALSVDVEDYFHAEAITGHTGRNDWDSMQCRVVDNTRRVLELLARHNTRATFFVLGWVASHFPFLVREIRDAGHELGCHSYWHRLVYRLTPGEFREDTRRAKEAVEDAAGVKVVGYRAPSFSITQRSLWALEILWQLGFRYDSSIFPVHHDFYGIPSHPRFSCPHGVPGRWEIIEYPMATWRAFGRNLPFGGGGYLRLLPMPYTHFAFHKVNDDEGQPVVCYFHPWEIDPGQPHLRVPTRSRLRHYTNLRKMAGRIADLLRRYRFCPLGELWVQRTAMNQRRAIHE